MSNTKLSTTETEHIAKLAKIILTKKEKETLSGQISEILDFVEKISEVKTEDVEPLSNVLGLKNVFRDDEIKPSLTQEEALSNSSDTFKGYFKVKAVFEND